MNSCSGKHPVYVSHMEEIEQMQDFLKVLMQHLKDTDPEYKAKRDCLLRIMAKCKELLLRMAAEESDILLVSDLNLWWIRNIVEYVQDVVRKHQPKAG